MKHRILLFVIGIYLGILFMIAFAHGDVSGTRTERKIIVVGIDTGVDITHPVLSDLNIVCDELLDCVDGHGHGTSIASLILLGELNEKNQPTNKACSRVEYHSCNYIPGFTDGSSYYKCLKYAKKVGANFINFSSETPRKDTVESEMIQDLTDSGVIFVTAMGNSGVNVKETPAYPAFFSIEKRFHGRLIPVMALTRRNTRWASSNYGIPGKMELGVGVRSAWGKGTIQHPSGTSMAAALHTNRLITQECAK